MTTEVDIRPRAGRLHHPDYNNLASSTGLVATPGRPESIPVAVPTWFEWTGSDDTIDYFNVFGGDIDENIVVRGDLRQRRRGDDRRHWARQRRLLSPPRERVTPTSAAPRASGGATAPPTRSRTSPRTSSSSPGCNIIMLKVFEGGGGHGFRLRFQDDLGNPMLARLIHLRIRPARSGGGGRRLPPRRLERLRRPQHHGRRLRPQLPLPRRARAPLPGRRGLGRQRPAQHHGRRPHPQLPLPRRTGPARARDRTACGAGSGGGRPADLRLPELLRGPDRSQGPFPSGSALFHLQSPAATKPAQ